MDRELDNIGRGARRARRTLNGLITACQEDILADEDAIRAVRDRRLGDELHHRAHQRAEFVGDLRRAVIALGGRPATEASGLAWTRSILRHVRAFVAGWHEGDAYAAVASAEGRTAAVYRDALAGPLPDDARFGVKRQLAQIETDLADALRMRGLH